MSTQTDGGGLKLSMPLVIVIVVVAAVALYFGLTKSGIVNSGGRPVPVGPPSQAMGAMMHRGGGGGH